MEVFNNRQFGNVRGVMVDGIPWFVGKDIATALGYSNPQKAIRDHVDMEDRGVNEMGTPGGKQETVIINESGMYSLILRSRLSSARKFKRWVTSEVLPSLRNDGVYAIKGNEEKHDIISKIHEYGAFNTILIEAGFSKEISTMTMIEDMKERGIFDGTYFLKSLGKTEDVGGLNPTEIANKSDFRLTPKMVNDYLKEMGLQYKDKYWKLTKDGKEYGEYIPFSNNGHTGYRILWKDGIIKELNRYLEKGAIAK